MEGCCLAALIARTRIEMNDNSLIRSCIMYMLNYLVCLLDVKAPAMGELRELDSMFQSGTLFIPVNIFQAFVLLGH